MQVKQKVYELYKGTVEQENADSEARAGVCFPAVLYLEMYEAVTLPENLMDMEVKKPKLFSEADTDRSKRRQHSKGSSLENLDPVEEEFPPEQAGRDSKMRRLSDIGPIHS